MGSRFPPDGSVQMAGGFELQLTSARTTSAAVECRAPLSYVFSRCHARSAEGSRPVEHPMEGENS